MHKKLPKNLETCSKHVYLFHEHFLDYPGSLVIQKVENAVSPHCLSMYTSKICDSNAPEYLMAPCVYVNVPLGSLDCYRYFVFEKYNFKATSKHPEAMNLLMSTFCALSFSVWKLSSAKQFTAGDKLFLE